MMLGLLALGLLGCVTDVELDAALDRDGDGFLPVVAGGPDCDEGRADVNPGQVEICGDGIDNDCDGVIDDSGTGNRTFYVDADNDGFGTGDTLEACELPPGYAEIDGDCDDGSSAFNPAAEDFCDGVDQDCDGLVDDDAVFRVLFEDADNDGTGNPDVSVEECSGVDGYVADSTDCDDADANVRPGVEDLCNGVDDDCDGAVDDDAEFAFAYIDLDGDGIGDSTTGLITCSFGGRVLVAGDCNDSDANVRPGIADGCDGVDTDCDGAPDDDADFVLTFADADGDGSGDPLTADVRCDLAGRVPNGDDCDDTDASFAPNQTDACDGLDQDCDGLVDDDAPTDLWFPDADGDGFGDPEAAVSVCGGAPEGHIALGGDCDDTDPLRQIPTWYLDADGDGYGAGDGVPGCEAPADHVEDNTDCDDGLATRNPGLEEVCKNGIDDDCSDETMCRIGGEIFSNSIAIFNGSPHEGQSDYRIGNVLGGTEDEFAIGDRVVIGDPDIEISINGLLPNDAYVDVPGLIPAHGVDLDEDGYNELLTFTNGFLRLVHGGDLAVLEEVEANIRDASLFRLDSMRGYLWRNENLEIWMTEFGSNVNRMVASNCDGTYRIAGEGILFDQAVLESPAGRFSWMTLDELASSSLPIDCDDFNAMEFLSDRARMFEDRRTGQIAFVDEERSLTEHNVRIRVWEDAWAAIENRVPMYDVDSLATLQILGGMGDVDGDGLMDFVGGSPRRVADPVRMPFHYGDGFDPTAPSAGVYITSGGNIHGIRYASGQHDFDGDGYDDAIFLGTYSQGRNFSMIFGSGI